MYKKAFALIFAMVLVTAPFATHAGFFDMFKFGSSQNAEVRTAIAAYKKGDKADVILQVQNALAAQKMYDGDMSGLIGPKTETAIKAWQKSHGLAVTGMLDSGTIASIMGRGGESVGGNRDGIVCAGSAPQIMVTSPNGGESYAVGAQIEVTWETCNIPSSANIFITMGASPTGQGHTFLTTAGSGTPNDGSETFTLSHPVGTYYVSAFRSAPNYLRDFSDASFSIEEQVGGLPTIASLQTQCNTSNGNTSGRWSRVMFPWVGDQILHPSMFTLQVVVCDVVDPSHPRTLVVFASNQGQLQTQLYRSDTSAQAQGMELEIDNSYAPLKVYNITMNTAQFPFPVGFHTMKSSLYHPDNNDLVEQTWTAPGAFEIVEELGGGNTGTTVCNAQLLYPHPGQSYNLEENSNGTGYSVRVHVFLYINQNLNNNGCVWDTSGITFPMEGNNPPGGSAGLVSLDGGTNGYPLWIHGDHMYHQSIDFNPNNSNTPAGPYNLTVLDGEGHEIVVPINISY